MTTLVDARHVLHSDCPSMHDCQVAVGEEAVEVSPYGLSMHSQLGHAVVLKVLEVVEAVLLSLTADMKMLGMSTEVSVCMTLLLCLKCCEHA